MSIVADGSRNLAELRNADKQIVRDAVRQPVLHERSLVILDKRVLNRECFKRVLENQGLNLQLLEFDTLEDWKREKDIHAPAAAILVSVSGAQIGSEEYLQELRQMTSDLEGTPVIVMGDSDDLSDVLRVLDCGTRGYFPTSMGMAVCVEAIRLAMAGGTFVPASALMAVRHKFKSPADEDRPMTALFTQRQAEVANALRRGKANKIIAYELNLRESTVKVHIRNIMKKLKATNRTEVAFKINKLMEEEGRSLQ